MQLAKYFFHNTCQKLKPKHKIEVFLKNLFYKFEGIGKSQLLIYSHFLKKFLKERFHFSGYWLFLKKSNNEGVIINILPRIGLFPPTSVLPDLLSVIAVLIWDICPNSQYFWIKLHHMEYLHSTNSSMLN